MRILLVEDNPGDARLVEELLKEAAGDFGIEVAESLGAGMELLASRNFDVVLLDLGLPDSRGLETLTRLRARFARLPVVILTSTDDEALGVQAVQLGAQDYVPKGSAGGELLRRILRYAIERKQVEEALESANLELERRVEDRTRDLRVANELAGMERQRLYDVLEALPAMICLITPDYRIPFTNKSFRDKFGEPLGRRCYEYCFGRAEPCDFCESFKVFETGKPHQWEVACPDGSVISAHDLPFTDMDGSQLILEMDLDITDFRRTEKALKDLNATLEQRVAERTSELRASEEALRASLHEKEVLLKEIHHRVKNNMQVISSLISLQADGSKDTIVREILNDVTDRVRSMALIHEKLYQSADLASINFADYARGLLSYIWRSHGDVASSVVLELDLEPVSLSVESAVPLGLILNELAGNTLKHAFKGRSGGKVMVSLANGDGRSSLSVSDNGTGLPEGLDWRKAQTLGLRLVQMLSAQIGASVDAESGEGTRFEITWTKPQF